MRAQVFEIYFTLTAFIFGNYLFLKVEKTSVTITINLTFSIYVLHLLRYLSRKIQLEVLLNQKSK